MLECFSWLLWLVFLFCTGAADICPCESPDLCRQVQKERDFEVFVFDDGGKTWKSFNWSMVTTVAAFGKYDPELMCHAHSVGARVVFKGDVNLADIVDQNNRTAWIKGMVDLAQRQFMDGINLDIEQVVESDSPEYRALTELVRETAEAFHTQIPGSQVSFDVAFSPNCTDNKRCYDYASIAKYSDLIFVMSYDEIWAGCVAIANAPLEQTLNGYDQYLKLTDHKKIIMGIPWYGYDYSCLSLSQEGICYIKEVPFRGAPYSDAPGRQKPYSWIMKQVNRSKTGRLWDNKQKAPYFNYMDEWGKIHQVWYDDPESLCPKANAVKSKGLRGIGMWNGDLLDYGSDPVAQQQTAAMWNVLLGC